MIYQFKQGKDLNVFNLSIYTLFFYQRPYIYILFVKLQKLFHNVILSGYFVFNPFLEGEFISIEPI